MDARIFLGSFLTGLALAACPGGAALAQDAVPPLRPAPPEPPVPPGPPAPPGPPPSTRAAPADPNAAAESFILPGRSSRGSRGLPSVQAPQTGQQGWSLSLGPGVIVRPKYIGSEAYEITPIPAFSLGYDDWFFIDPATGAGVRQDVLPGATLSGGIDYGGGREESDDDRLQGMGDLDGGVTGFAELELQPFQQGIGRAISVDLGAETPLTGDIDGFEATADLALSFPLFGYGYGSISGGVIWSDEKLMNDLFGVSPAQAAASGLPAFQASSGIRAYSFGFTTITELGGNWSGLVLAGYDRLTGDAADSPISETNDQYTLAAGILYTFD